VTLSLEVREQIIKLRKEGYIDSAIVRMLGVSQPSVHKICKAAGIPKPELRKQLGRRTKHFYSNDQRQEIVSLRKQGYVIRAIAEKLDLNERCVNHACKHAGLGGTIGHLGRKPMGTSPFSERNGEMRDLRGQGLTLQQIGDKYGITRERVRQLCVGVEKPDLRVRKNCGICGEEFIPGDNPGYTSYRYCSRECGKKGMSINSRTPESKWSSHGTVKLTCSGCGVDFERVNYIAAIAKRQRERKGLNDSGMRFCSRECYWENSSMVHGKKEEDE
jgi:DNA-binding CsgD family transcriptional regulator